MYHSTGLPPQVQRLRASGGGLPPGLPGAGGGGRGGSRGGPAGSIHHGRRAFFVDRDYSPSKWSDYFTEKKDILLENGDQFRVYLKEDESASTNNLPLLVLLHGGGFSGLTWSCFVKSISELCHVRILAIDLRGHGSSKTSDDEILNIANFVNDIDRILLKLYECDAMPEIILMGHSMGGAVAVHYVDECQVEAITSRIVGLIVIDVVEGTAKEALSQMQQVLRSRPGGFKSVEYAIEWYVRSGQVKNMEAAKISMPGQIKQTDSGVCATDLEISNTATSNTASDSSDNPTSSSSTPPSFGLSAISETETSEEPSPSPPATTGESSFTHPSPSRSTSQAFTWRINLSNTEKYWSEWFTNLSSIFLSPKGGAKLLLLAGVDRLDGPMTVGQMQGKFQMQILPKVGHTIQEDDPDSVAHVIAAYLVRNRFSVSKTEFDYPFPSC